MTKPRLPFFRLILGLMWLLLAVAPAVEVTDGPRVESRGTQAVVRWRTDTACGATVKFGLAPNALTRSAKATGVGTDHAVTLEGLQAGKTYHFSIGTARLALGTGNFVAGSPGATPSDPPPAAGKPPAPEPAWRRLFKKSPPAATEKEVAPAPPARQTWRNPVTLRDHFERHGRDFAARDAEDYAAQAWRFLQRARAEGLPAKLDEEGTLRVWDRKTEAFAAYGLDGRTKTYFKPGSPGYFQRQPGRPVRLKPVTSNSR